MLARKKDAPNFTKLCFENFRYNSSITSHKKPERKKEQC